MSWHPHVTVAAVIRDDDHFLVVEEAPDGASVINQPAGHLEAGESLLDAVRREVREETTRAFTPEGLVGIYRWPVPDGPRTYLRFCFSGSVGAPDPATPRDPDILDNHWLTLDAIESGGLQPRSPLVVRCFADALRSAPLPLSILKDLDHVG